MHKIQRLSRRFSYLFIALMIILPSLSAIYWGFFPFFKQVGWQVSTMPLEQMVDTPLTRTLAFSASMMPILNIMVGLYWLHRLFKHFASGIIFSMANVAIYKNIGFTLFALAITENLFDSCMTWIMTFMRPQGAALSIGFDTSQIIYVVMGSLILLTSYVMHEAYILDDECRYTV